MLIHSHTFLLLQCHMFMHRRVYTYVYTRIHTYKYTHTHTFTTPYTHTYTHTIYIHTHKHTHLLARMADPTLHAHTWYIHIHYDMHPWTHTLVFLHSHVFIHKLLQKQAWRSYIHITHMPIWLYVHIPLCSSIVTSSFTNCFRNRNDAHTYTLHICRYDSMDTYPCVPP
jgi:hypothetical protein